MSDSFDHEVAGWQGKIAVAAKTGNGLDSLKAAFNWVKHNVPPVNGLRELAKRQISEAAERHLSQTHEPEILDAILFSTFPEDATGNSDLDAEITQRDKDAEATAEIERLAKLPLIQYERERKSAAEKLCIKRIAMLDRIVQATRPKNDDTRRQGRPIEFTQVEPWSKAVDGADLLCELSTTLRKYVIVTDEQADAISMDYPYLHARCERCLTQTCA
jgi:hypothetical protein